MDLSGWGGGGFWYGWIYFVRTMTRRRNGNIDLERLEQACCSQILIGVNYCMEQKLYYLFWAYLNLLSVFNMSQIRTLNDNSI